MEWAKHIDWAGISVPLVIGGIIGFAFNHLSGYSKEFFERRERSRKHKNKTLSAVYEIVNKGIISRFQTFINNREEIYNVEVDLKNIDKGMYDTFSNFLAFWEMFVDTKDHTNRTKEYVEERNRTYTHLQKLGFELQAWTSENKEN